MGIDSNCKSIWEPKFINVHNRESIGKTMRLIFDIAEFYNHKNRGEMDGRFCIMTCIRGKEAFPPVGGSTGYKIHGREEIG